MRPRNRIEEKALPARGDHPRYSPRALRRITATLLGWATLARLWDTSEPHVVFEQKFAGVQCFRLEGWAVCWDEAPVADLAAQQFDESNRRKVFADSRVGEISGLRKDEPDAVVFRLLKAVSQHEHDLLPNINCEA